MQVLNFSTGLVTYKVNGGAEITFNPTDTAFGQKVMNIFRDLSGKQDECQKLLTSGESIDPKAALEDPEVAKEMVSQADAMLGAIARMDKDMRASIDSAFGVPGTADAVFGSMNLYAFADGLPLWANFLLAVIDEMPASAEKQAQLTDPRLRKYVGKYSSKYHK